MRPHNPVVRTWKVRLPLFLCEITCNGCATQYTWNLFIIQSNMLNKNGRECQLNGIFRTLFVINKKRLKKSRRIACESEPSALGFADSLRVLLSCRFATSIARFARGYEIDNPLGIGVCWRQTNRTLPDWQSYCAHFSGQGGAVNLSIGVKIKKVNSQSKCNFGRVTARTCTYSIRKKPWITPWTWKNAFLGEF